MNLMTRLNQTRHQLLPDRSRRSCDKHSHHRLLDRGFYLHPTRQDGSPGCDTSEHPGTETRARGWTRIAAPRPSLAILAQLSARKRGRRKDVGKVLYESTAPAPNRVGPSYTSSTKNL